MNKKFFAAAGAGTMIAAALVPMTAANAADAAGDRGKLCHQGRFFVVHQGDKINNVMIPQGSYKTYAHRVPCTSVIVDLHNWLGTGETTDGWTVSSAGRGKRSLEFSSPSGKAHFVIKRIKNQPPAS